MRPFTLDHGAFVTRFARKGALCVLLLAIWLGGVVTPLQGYGSSLYGAYSIRNWDSEDGLPHNTVTALLQTRDGYLWIGTTNGLARFNGQDFLVYDLSTHPELVDPAITALYEDASGVLWIAHGIGRLSKISQGRVESVPFVTQYQRICTLFADGAHRLCVCMLSGDVYVVETGEQLLAPQATGEPLNLRYARGGDGRFLISAYSLLYELKGTHFEALALPFGKTDRNIRGLGVSHDGAWWLIRGKEITRGRNGTWEAPLVAWGNEEISSILELRNGQLAISTNFDGLKILSPDGQRTCLNMETVHMPNWVRAIHEDREGILWAGAGSAGLFGISSAGISALSPPEGWHGFAALSVTMGRDGSVWVGTEGGGIHRYASSGWKHYGVGQGLTNLYVWALAEDPQGRLWAGTWDGNLFYLENDRFVEAVELRLESPIFSLQFNTSEGRLYAGTGNGLYCAELGKRGWLFHAQGSDNVAIPDLASGENGELWLALGKDGLGRLEAGKVTRFPLQGSRGLPARVQCLGVDRGALWIGTAEDGLFCFREGRFEAIHLNAKRGVPSIHHIEDDGVGRLWLNTSHGIVRLEKDELLRCLGKTADQVFAKTYDREDGMPAAAFYGSMKSAACRAADGVLWFANTKGLIWLNPRHSFEARTPPPIRIEQMLVNGVPLPLPAGTPPTLSPRQSRLEFRFATLSYRSPRNNSYRYRLRGWDDNWVQCGSARTAQFTRLPAGDYCFEVMGSDADGTWSEAPASIRFSITQYFWRTWWFSLAVLLAATSGVIWLVRHLTRRRLQRRLAQLEQERGLERERTRIARDIHDEVGSSITRITMLSDSFRAEAPGDRRIAERIRQISVEVTDTLDEIVWAINPRNDTLRSLACYMAHHVQERVEEAGFSCRLDMSLNQPDLPMLSPVRHHLVLAFKEAVSNALKHSGGDELQVELAVSGDRIQVVVADNGRGLPSGVSPLSETHSGNGLANMRSRMDSVGGACDISPRKEGGTRVTLSVPIQGVLRARTDPTTEIT